MRAHQRSMVVAFVLLAAASGGASAEVSWGGPGWYVEGTQIGLDTTLISGPYPSEAECKAAQPADDNDYAYSCEYETSDPSDDSPP